MRHNKIFLLISLVGVLCVTAAIFLSFKNELYKADELSNCGAKCNLNNLDLETATANVWAKKKQYFVDNINQAFKNKNSYPALYNTQIYTNNMLTYAAKTKNYKILSEMSEMLLAAYPHLQQKSDYAYYYYPAPSGVVRQSIHPLKTPAKMWLTKNPDNNIEYEDILASSQFAFELSQAINEISKIPASSRTTQMNELISKYSPVLVNDLYYRWVIDDTNISQVKGWGCENYDLPNYSFSQIMEKKINGSLRTRPNAPTYCDSYTDTEMWMLDGVVQLMNANRLNPSQVVLTDTQKSQFNNFIKIGLALTQKRITRSTTQNFVGQTVSALNLGVNEWNDHPDHAYAGYTGDTYPTEAQKAKASTGWDISHARRFVNLFYTLYENKAVTGSSFPTDEDMTAYANQMIYKTFNRDYNLPLFTNFNDGTNGWYRVGYSGRTDFGYAPYDLSVSFATGGYGFLATFNSDYYPVLKAVWNASVTQDASLSAQVKKYYDPALTAKDDFFRFYFLPVLATQAKLDTKANSFQDPVTPQAPASPTTPTTPTPTPSKGTSKSNNNQSTKTSTVLSTPPTNSEGTSTSATVINPALPEVKSQVNTPTTTKQKDQTKANSWSVAYLKLCYQVIDIVMYLPNKLKQLFFY